MAKFNDSIFAICLLTFDLCHLNFDLFFFFCLLPSPLLAAATGGAYMPPFGMYVVMAIRSAVPGVPVHSSPIAKRSRTSQNDVRATRPMFEGRFAV
jgi:hypothetical protein